MSLRGGADEKSNPPPASFCRVCTRVCVRVPTCVLYEADTSITYSSALSAGLPHSVFQHASQSLRHMHYLTLTLPLMQIAAEMFMLDMLAYRLERFSHRLWRRSLQISPPRVCLFYVSAHLVVQTLPEITNNENYQRSGLKMPLNICLKGV